MNYRIGLDIGIGSIGWAVINKDRQRIEDFGVRIFESGENEAKKNRKSQIRRGFRGTRRLERRREHRREMLKKHLEVIGFLGKNFEDEYADVKDEDVHLLKVKGLDEKLSPAELFKCLIHFCNHRGYKDFYEDSIEEDDDLSDDIDEDAGKNKRAAALFDNAYKASGYRTVSEYLVKTAKLSGSDRPIEFRNIDSRKEDCFMLIHRALLKEEAALILKKQGEYYPCLNEKNTSFITDGIIFAQRDFETGPGKEGDPTRRYQGFLASLGKCPFNHEENRGFRSTVISDLFAVSNTLSQYKYIDAKTGEIVLPKELAQKIINHTLHDGNITMTDVKSICSDFGFKLQKSDNSDDKALSKAIKFLKPMKRIADDSGLYWEEFISEEQLCATTPSKLHLVGEIISKFQTPSRRKAELNKLTFLNPKAVKMLSTLKISGTSGAGYTYMCDAVNAFLSGDIYGNYQANYIKDNLEASYERHYKLSASDIADPDVSSNPVVFRAINETRKIVNAIIDIYGSPAEINIEVAGDLSRSFEDRDKIRKQQKNNEKANEIAVEDIARILNIKKEGVSGKAIDRYKLYKAQNGICLYSGKPLGELKDILNDNDHTCEVDHIVPFSLILDNTLNNKALVLAKENQDKGQRCPLMYLEGEKRDKFKARVNEMFSRKDERISKKKYEYLMLETVYNYDKLSEWKSRNINDTRYITKYIMGIFSHRLSFANDEGRNVFAVKGALTSKFRRIWLRGSDWGNDEKNRESYLNHAVDAVVIANLTPGMIELAYENLRLYDIYKKHARKPSDEYEAYLAAAKKRLNKYYGYSDEYADKLLRSINRVPSFIPRLYEEVAIRFDIKDEKELLEKCRGFYTGIDDFIIKPHIPIASMKQEKRFRGEIADANPIKLIEEDGNIYKVSRKKIEEISAKHLPLIRSNDIKMLEKLHEILDGKADDDKYTVGKYLKEQGLTKFVLDNGRSVYKVSLRESGTYSAFYKKQISDNNFSILGSPKYYCVELYEDNEGKLRTRGVRYVDIVKRGKKLLVKAESIPGNYAKHIMYLFKNDFVEIRNAKGNIYCEGFYQSVYNINQSQYRFKPINVSESKPKSISANSSVTKIDISILGRKGGFIKCSEPLSLTEEKK